MIITGEIVRLRPISDDDTDNIIRWRNSDHVRNNFIYQTLFDRESHTRWLREKVDTGLTHQFIIRYLPDDIDVGSVYLRDVDLQHKKAEFGIFIGEADYMNKGIGTQCIQLILDYGFKTLGLHKIYLRVLADNERAVRTYEGVGFLREAYLKDEVCIKGSYRDLILMRILND